jgi:hypothetical protein
MNCKVKNYKGIRPPRCNKGKGCSVCWGIYYTVNPPKKTSKVSELSDFNGPIQDFLKIIKKLAKQYPKHHIKFDAGYNNVEVELY